jgi:hypothetical protein
VNNTSERITVDFDEGRVHISKSGAIIVEGADPEDISAVRHLLLSKIRY